MRGANPGSNMETACRRLRLPLTICVGSRRRRRAPRGIFCGPDIRRFSVKWRNFRRAQIEGHVAVYHCAALKHPLSEYWPALRRYRSRLYGTRGAEAPTPEVARAGASSSRALFSSPVPEIDLELGSLRRATGRCSRVVAGPRVPPGARSAARPTGQF